MFQSFLFSLFFFYMNLSNGGLRKPKFHLVTWLSHVLPKRFKILWLQVAKVLQTLIPMPGGNPNDPRLKELEEMEEQKAEIDKKADILVRRELWGGLGFLVLQTAGFMRLTFWELSWDVMEPICFYVTSMYCMAGYTFFLRTSKEPSFEGFYQSRFQSKQKRLMKINNFDIAKYDALQRACYPNSVFSEQAATSTGPIGKVHFGTINH